MNKTKTHILASLALTTVAIIAPSIPAHAEDPKFTPFISLSGEFNDNIFETASNRRSEYITHVQPGLASRYEASLWNWDLSYSFDYRRYERNSHSPEYTHYAGLRGTVKLVENLLHVDVSDTYKRVSTDVTRDATYQNSLFLNQTDQNIASVSPYLLFRPSQKSSLRIGYRYSDVRYWGEGIEKRDHAAFADLTHELTEKLSLTAAYGFDAVDADDTRYHKHDASAGFRYAYGEKSFLFGQVGNTWQNFEQSRNVSFLFWNVGLTHDLGLAIASLTSGVQITEDPLGTSTRATSYGIRLDRAFDRASLGVSAAFVEYEDTFLSHSTTRQTLTLGVHGSYELIHGLTGTLAATSDHYNGQPAGDPDYRVSGTAGLSYAFNYGIAMGLNYTYVTYLGGSTGTREVNRVVVDLKKSF